MFQEEGKTWDSKRATPLISSLSEVDPEGDAGLVRDHCDLNCTHSLVTTFHFLALNDCFGGKTLSGSVVQTDFARAFFGHTHTDTDTHLRAHNTDAHPSQRYYFILFHLTTFICSFAKLTWKKYVETALFIIRSV